MRAIGISQFSPDRDRADVTATRRVNACQAVCEEEKRDFAIIEKIDDLLKNRKRRVVHDDLARVVLALIIATRPERPDDGRLIDTVFFGHKVQHGLVDQIRRHAVIGRPLGLEFLDKLIVGFALAHVPALIAFAAVSVRIGAANHAAMTFCASAVPVGL